MSKYNKFAKELEAAFFEAREKYVAAANALKEAQAAKVDAYTWQKEKIIGENAERRARADLALTKAEIDFNRVKHDVWHVFEKTASGLTAQLKDEVEKNNLVDPAAIDGESLELLKSGILTAADFENIAAKFENNVTMSRLVSKYAAEAAEHEQDNQQVRSKLMAIAQKTQNKDEAILHGWNQIIEVAHTLTGQAHGVGEMNYTIDLSGRWTQLLGQTIEDF